MKRGTGRETVTGRRRRGGRRRATLLMCALAAGLPPAAAQEADTLGEALREGELGLGLRYRLESIDDEAFSKPGWASTLRTALSFQSLAWHGFAIGAEVENVVDVGMADLHDNLGAGDLFNGVRDRPVIADPALTEVNQATVGWGYGPLVQVRLGRREITLGNQRFVGNVAWRQNHQSFDAVTLELPVGEPSGVTYAYVEEVHGVTGATREMASHLLEADLALWGRDGTVSVYGFLLDYRSVADEGLSTATFGARLERSLAISAAVEGLLDVELAYQQGYAGNPAAVDVWYYRAGIGAGAGRWTARLSREVLEGGPDKGRFQTPLATLHAWNGWADQFLVTPVDGLQDTFLGVTWVRGHGRLEGVFHRFRAATGGADYGRELDLEARFETSWGQTVALSGAFYDADGYGRDVNKLWLWTSWSL